MLPCGFKTPVAQAMYAGCLRPRPFVRHPGCDSSARIPRASPGHPRIKGRAAAAPPYSGSARPAASSPAPAAPAALPHRRGSAAAGGGHGSPLAASAAAPRSRGAPAVLPGPDSQPLQPVRQRQWRHNSRSLQPAANRVAAAPLHSGTADPAASSAAPAAPRLPPRRCSAPAGSQARQQPRSTGSAPAAPATLTQAPTGGSHGSPPAASAAAHRRRGAPASLPGSGQQPAPAQRRHTCPAPAACTAAASAQQPQPATGCPRCRCPTAAAAPSGRLERGAHAGPMPSWHLACTISRAARFSCSQARHAPCTCPWRGAHVPLGRAQRSAARSDAALCLALPRSRIAMP